ncbi:hypothetical protein CA984_15280 [Streptosporangium minutum]|uniref:Uncharacterized protein n=1 Tax=Streptosporangium minutum TaxID=569862 RepID=A0A243RN10_9ACTN|nr:hypothetical protein CA984_15280 [Streptosporangium minutum]
MCPPYAKGTPAIGIEVEQTHVTAPFRYGSSFRYGSLFRYGSRLPDGERTPGGDSRPYGTAAATAGCERRPRLPGEAVGW